MAEKIPADLKAAYTLETRTSKAYEAKRERSVKLRAQLDEVSVETNRLKELFVKARSEVRKLEREHDIGEWADPGVEPHVIGRQTENGQPVPKELS